MQNRFIDFIYRNAYRRTVCDGRVRGKIRVESSVFHVNCRRGDERAVSCGRLGKTSAEFTVERNADNRNVAVLKPLPAASRKGETLEHFVNTANIILEDTELDYADLLFENADCVNALVEGFFFAVNSRSFLG